MSDWDRLVGGQPEPEGDPYATQPSGVRRANGGDAPPPPPRRRPYLPWVIVGAVVLAALIVSIIVIAVSRATPGPAASPTPSRSASASPSASATPLPSASASPRPSSSPTPTPSPSPTSSPNDPPRGPTNTLDITQWGVVAQLDQRLGSAEYSIDGQQRLTLSSTLMQQLPASCSAAQSGWGFQKVDGPGNGARQVGGAYYQRLTPSGGCPADPALYSQIDTYMRWAFESLTAG